MVDPTGLEGVGSWNNGEVTLAFEKKDYEKNSFVDYLVNLTPVGSFAQLGMDFLGIDTIFWWR